MGSCIVASEGQRNHCDPTTKLKRIRELWKNSCERMMSIGREVKFSGFKEPSKTHIVQPHTTWEPPCNMCSDQYAYNFPFCNFNVCMLQLFFENCVGKKTIPSTTTNMSASSDVFWYALSTGASFALGTPNKLATALGMDSNKSVSDAYPVESIACLQYMEEEQHIEL